MVWAGSPGASVDGAVTVDVGVGVVGDGYF
jgi:hypothetical protein